MIQRVLHRGGATTRLRLVGSETKRDDTEPTTPPSRFASDQLNATMLTLQADALSEKAQDALRDGHGHLAARRALAAVHAREAARILRMESA